MYAHEYDPPQLDFQGDFLKRLRVITGDGELNSTKLAVLRSSLRVEHLAENLVPPRVNSAVGS